MTGIHLGLGLGSRRKKGLSVFAKAPTDITLSNSTIPEDTGVGLFIGQLLAIDDPGDTFTYTIVADPDSKFTVNQDVLILGAAVDFETATSHSVTIRATDQDLLYFDKQFTINITDVNEADPPPEPNPDDIVIIFEGPFDIDPIVDGWGGKPKIHGKSKGLVGIIMSIGIPKVNGIYIMQYDPDFTLLSNTGKDSMVGFGVKENNNFHIVGLKGDGGTALDIAKVYHSNWTNLQGATVSVGSVTQNGTQAGPNWVKIVVSGDGTTYTFSSGSGADIGSVVWDAEYTASAPTPLANMPSALQFGPALYLPATDIGIFSVEVTIWQSPLYTINLSNDTLLDLTEDTVVGTLTTVGGQQPYTYEIVDPAAKILDGLSPTGAFSFSRNLLAAYVNPFYADTAGAITTWYDQSGAARNVTDGASAARRPTLSTAGPKSIACGDFDGSSDYLAGVAISNHITNPEGFMIVSCIFDTLTATLGAYKSDGHVAMSDAGGYIGMTSEVGGKVYAVNYDGSGPPADNVSVAVLTATAYVLALRHSGGTLYLSVNGGAEVSIVSGNTTALTGLLSFGYRSTAAYLDGKIFEAATFSTVPNATKRALLIADMMNHIGAV